MQSGHYIASMNRRNRMLLTARKRRRRAALDIYFGSRFQIGDQGETPSIHLR